MNKTKKKLIIIVAALIAVMAISGTAAYFTSTDEANNTWTVGSVKIELQEPEYEQFRAVEGKAISPNYEVHKDPKAVNTGSSDAFVFMKVRVPKANVKVATPDGTIRAEASVQELFAYEWNTGWTVVESKEIEEDNGLYQEYVLSYGTDEKCVALKPREETPVLFRNAIGSHINTPGRIGLITFKNIVDGQGFEDTKLDMNVQTFAIQAENLTTADVEEPEKVWDVLTAQTGM